MKMESVVVALLVGLVMGGGVGAVAKSSCPLPADILPCLCFDDDPLGLVMDCSGVQNEPELAKSFTANFPTPDFYELRIIHDPMNLNQSLHFLKKSTFGEATFQRVNITGTQIITIDGYAFDKSKLTLTVLSLDWNKIEQFSFGSLARYTSLIALHLAHNNLRHIPQLVSPVLKFLDVTGNRPLVIEQEAFAETPLLEQIILSHTSQEKLERGLFTALGQMDVLDFSDNNLKEVQGGVIVTPNASMTVINLSNNEITMVHHDAIVGLASNALLSLAKNEITQLQQLHWQHIFDQLKLPYGLIDLSENPLLCGCEIAWIVLNDDYRNLFTDTTKCVNGEMVIFLDPLMYTTLCRPFV
ncbi:oplophorus-luciferin 2-monooxygenase non-catalytic subunit-like [Scylla paramamosain]|uniref:oplophorus-luciferin 2-monooxygenase non-catalytic subunit-like n=1 Tax=Scylla paramamosain TaxID=85552 RepID=UPI00308285C3